MGEFKTELFEEVWFKVIMIFLLLLVGIAADDVEELFSAHNLILLGRELILI